MLLHVNLAAVASWPQDSRKYLIMNQLRRNHTASELHPGEEKI